MAPAYVTGLSAGLPNRIACHVTAMSVSAT